MPILVLAALVTWSGIGAMMFSDYYDGIERFEHTNWQTFWRYMGFGPIVWFLLFVHFIRRLFD